MRKLIITLLISGMCISSAIIAHGQSFQLPPQSPVSRGEVISPILTSDGSGVLAAAKDILDDPLGSAIKGIGSVMFGGFELKAMGKLLWGINIVIGFIGSILFSIAAFLVQIGIYFNATILDTAVVQLGWRIMRDLANLGFTIGIVVIAYATILGIEAYSIKNALAWLIIAAVMVNFSFSIAGVFIDASNLVTNFFVSKSIVGKNGAGALPFSNVHGFNFSVQGFTDSGAAQFAASLANAFGPQRLLQINKGNEDIFTKLSSYTGMFVLVAATFFIALFTILATLGMLAVALATLWRFLALSGLIVVMPGAILAWGISPTGTGQYWKKWWGEFMNQLIYLPLVTFFLYITITFITLQGQRAETGQLTIAQLNELSGDWTEKLLAIMMHPVQIMTEMILLLFFLFWGLTKSPKWSTHGASFITERIRGAHEWIISAKKSKYEGAGAREWAARKVLTAGSEPNKNLGNQAATITAKIPGAGGLTNWLKSFTSTATTNVEGYAKEYGALTDNQLLSKARNLELLLNEEKMAGMAKVIIQKGKISADPTKGLTMQEFAKFIGPAKRFGLSKEFLGVAPHLFKQFGMNTADLATFMSKNFKPDDMEKVSAESLGHPAVALNLTAAHIKKLKGPAQKERRENLINALKPDGWTQFVTDRITNKKDIDDIHEDFLKNQGFVLGLKATHADRIRDNDEFKQQVAFVQTISEAYDDFLVTDKQPLNDLAKPLIDKKNSIEWAGIMNNLPTRKMFDKIEDAYNKRGAPQPGGGGGFPRGGRGAGGGVGPRPAPPGNNPPTGGGATLNPPLAANTLINQTTPSPQQINRSPNTPT